MSSYVVMANMRGKRIASQVYQNRADAEKHARETNNYYRAANARVKKV
jgi:hypothetical protein